MSATQPSSKLKTRILTIGGYLFLIAGAIISFLPFYWMLILSTHSSKTIFQFPPPFLPVAAFGAMTVE